MSETLEEAKSRIYRNYMMLDLIIQNKICIKEIEDDIKELEAELKDKENDLGNLADTISTIDSGVKQFKNQVTLNNSGRSHILTSDMSGSLIDTKKIREYMLLGIKTASKEIEGKIIGNKETIADLILTFKNTALAIECNSSIKESDLSISSFKNIYMAAWKNISYVFKTCNGISLEEDNMIRISNSNGTVEITNSLDLYLELNHTSRFEFISPDSSYAEYKDQINEVNKLVWRYIRKYYNSLQIVKAEMDR